MTKTQSVKLGSTGPDVFPIGLGCMGMSKMYGDADESESIATIHEALERGVNLLDTGDFYGQGHNEMLVGRAIKGRRDRAILSVKFGGMRDPAGNFIAFDTRPVAVKNSLAYTLTRLGVDHIDIYRPARLDPAVPIEDTIGAIADMVKAGYVRHIALSEVGVDTIRRAAAVHPIVDLQIEYSLISRGPEEKIFPLLRELGIATTAYGVLSRGLLTASKLQGPNDFRAHLPRFTGEAGDRNRKLADTLAQLAAARGVSAAQLAIAWVRAKDPANVPVMGARTRTQLAESLGALAVSLDAKEIAALEDALPATAVAGTRYGDAQMKMLDSER
ncbi:MAG: aldo/keto reductase [Kofleriaceae bacterium]|nr:aldo/keto reductase [Kofleriaceae bacterium]